MSLPGLLLAAALLAAVLVVAQRFRARRAWTVTDDAELGRWLDETLPWRRHLDVRQKQRHLRQVRDFLRHVDFYGCQGQEVDARTAVVIAGVACLLTLRERGRAYPRLRAVLLYPAAFWVPQDEPDEFGLVSGDEVLHMGMSHETGRVILSWQDIEAALAGDPTNVAVHEFAHQLDDLGGGEGAPIGADPEQWPRVMRAAWEAFEDQPSPVLDDYGLESPGEFFAVTVEAFFQQPDALRAAHPELHALLVETFAVDFRGLRFPGRSALST